MITDTNIYGYFADSLIINNTVFGHNLINGWAFISLHITHLYIYMLSKKEKSQILS